MFRSQSRRTVSVLGLTLAAVILIPASALAQKPQSTVTYAPPTLGLASDTSVVTSCGTTSVQLNAKAVSPGGNPIRYRWSTSGGRITGEGPLVTWDLSGLAPGVYKAYIEIQTGNTDGECQAFTSTSVVVRACPPKIEPSCPNIEILCPIDNGVDQPIIFRARVSGGVPVVSPIYNWSVSAGTIMEGQGTSSIKVDTKGLAGQTVKASLSIGGRTVDCSASCAVSIPLPGAKSKKFDEFPDISRNDEKARLDNFAIELQNDPTATAYVVVYRGRSNRPSDVQKRAARIVDYMVHSRGIDASRIVTLVGGARETLMVELWVSPQGAPPPTP